MDVKEKPRRGRKRWVVVGLVVLLGLFVWWRHSGRQPRQSFAGPVQAVGVARAISGPMPEILDELGTVTPTDVVTIVPQISGYLMKVGFIQGQMVTKGQFLAQIDPRPYEIDLAQYEAGLAKDDASLAQARSDLARYRQLAAQNSISAQTVSDQAYTVAQEEAAVKMDQANIATAKLDLVYCHIVAPVTGRVGLRLIDPGNYVTSGSSTGIVVITTVSPTTVIFSVAQQELTPVMEQIEAGQTLTATAYGSDDVTKLEQGTLSAVDNQVNTSTGMVKLRADFSNADGKLFPNQFVNVHLLVKTLQHVMLVPSPAIQSGAQGDYVYVVQPDQTVKAQPVSVGPTDGVNTAIIKGLQAGALVVVDGLDRLAQGSKIHIVAQEEVTTNGTAEQEVPFVSSGGAGSSARAHRIKAQ